MMDFHMDSLRLVWLLLALNAAVAVVYALLAFRRIGLRAWLYMAIMLLCPVVGPILLGLSYVVLRLFLRNQQVDLAAVSFSHEKRVFIFAPDEEEGDLVPIEESLLVSSVAERRKAFLNSMRLNLSKNVALYTLGLENEDSETSHYSASIVMEANAGFQDTLQALGVEYEQHPDDTEIALAYANAVQDYLQSGILVGIERTRYEELYVFLMDALRARDPDALSPKDWSQAVSVLLALGELPRAQSWAQAGVERFPDEESAHLSLIQVYFTMGDSQRLRAAVDALRASYVSLSRDGAALIRFFLPEEASAPSPVEGGTYAAD